MHQLIQLTQHFYWVDNEWELIINFTQFPRLTLHFPQQVSFPSQTYFNLYQRSSRPTIKTDRQLNCLDLEDMMN